MGALRSASDPKRTFVSAVGLVSPMSTVWDDHVNWKTISLQIGLVLLTLGAIHFYARIGEHKRSEFLAREAEVLHAKSVVPMHHPPIQRDIIALAEKDSAAFCHPKDGSADGCRLDATFMDDQWIVFAYPYIGNAETGCCAVDSEHFLFTRAMASSCERRGADPDVRFRPKAHICVIRKAQK